MALKFEFAQYKWRLRAGFPPMGSIQSSVGFEDQLRLSAPELANYSTRSLGSWIVGRLNYIVNGNLPLEGEEFSHDTDEFGYKLKMSNSAGDTCGHGAITIGRDRIFFAYLPLKEVDLQDIVIALLTDQTESLKSCTITMTVNEPFQQYHYGWDGYRVIDSVG